jgi:hypothetical protein
MMVETVPKQAPPPTPTHTPTPTPTHTPLTTWQVLPPALEGTVVPAPCKSSVGARDNMFKFKAII